MYRIHVDDTTQAQLDALPWEALHAWRELAAVLEITPENGTPLNPAVPDGVLTWVFGPNGEGLACYLISDWDERVDLLDIQWMG
ncbi:hypothetical protein BAY61_32140 (plasmid) [Prauserella marina]|uniref:hypothetical protein n=1 Tax=Prauserella marina TaxID=530584 RepID=UPI000B80E392|nr:hypothetical protein [Prauserella marina]ASR39935.1 hypothetical protein BAY61_32140 [Prauserella marina]